MGRGVLLASLVVVVVVSSTTTGSTAESATGVRPSLPLHLKGRNVDLVRMGARCDGVHDDRGPLARAVRRVSRAGGGTVWVPDGTCRIVATALQPSIVLTDRVVIRGRSARSRLSLDSDDPTSFRALFTIRGDHVALRRLRLTRARDIYAVFIGLDASRRFTMSDVVIDGRKRGAEGPVVAGIMLHPRPGDRIRHASLRRVTIRHVGYGLFQPSSTLGRTRGLLVKNSRFAGNWADDLEFNAPATTMRHVRVVGSTFRHNRAPSSTMGVGIAVGLAHVAGARVVGNTFRGYGFEPIHIEDRSSRVVIAHNRFSRAGTAETNYAAHVLVLGDVRRVRIMRNSFDTTMNENSHVDCIYLGGGGLATGPDRVLIADNQFRLGPRSVPVAQYLATNVRLIDNIIRFL